MSWLMAMTVRPASLRLVACACRTRSHAAPRPGRWSARRAPAPASAWPAPRPAPAASGARRPGRRGWCAPPRPGPTAAMAPSTALRSSSPRRPTLRGPNSTSERTLPAKIWRSGSWKTRPTSRASWATVRRAASCAIDQHASRGWPQQAVQVPHQRGLAAAVLADQGDHLAGTDGQRHLVQGTHPALLVHVADRLQAQLRGGAPVMPPPPHAAAPAAPAAGRPPRPRGPAARRRAGPRPARSRRGSASTSAAGPSSATAPSATSTTRLQISASRSVFCSAIRIEAPPAGQASQGIGHQPAAGGVQLRGRLVQHQQAWAQGQQPGDGDQLLLAAGQPRRVARRSASMRSSASASSVRRMTSSRGRPRFIGPKATSS